MFCSKVPTLDALCSFNQHGQLGCLLLWIAAACAGDPCDFGLICRDDFGSTTSTCGFPSYAGDICQSTGEPHALYSSFH